MDIKDVILTALKENLIKDVDLRPGTGIYEFLVRGNEIIYTAFSDLMKIAYESATLSNYQSLDEATMDALVSNFLITRRVGDKARGVVRVYFANPVDIEITPVVIFATTDGRRYFPTNPRFYSQSEMSQNYDQTLGYYYLDINVEAENLGTQGNAAAGEINQVVNLGKPYALVTNQSAIETLAEHETNEQLYERLKASLTLRSLTSANSVITNLYEQFSSISDIFIVNFGHKLMWRDLVENIHRGAKTDVYIAMPRILNTGITLNSIGGLQLPVITNGLPSTITVASFDLANVDLLPPLQLKVGTTILTGARYGFYGIDNYGEGPYNYPSFDPASTYFYVEPIDDPVTGIKSEYVGSSEQKLRFYLPSVYIGQNIEVIGYKYESNQVNAYLRDPSNRPVVSDILAKHFWICFVEVDANIYRGDASLIRQAIIDYINSLKSTKPEMGDLIKYVEENVTTVAFKFPFNKFRLRVWNDRYEFRIYSYEEFVNEFETFNGFLYLPATEDPALGDAGVKVTL